MSEPGTYTTRPRTVKAMQVTRETLPALQEWAHVRTELTNLPGPGRGLTAGVTIRSLDGKVRAHFGDYLVLPLEVIGKADFEARFQAADAEEPTTDTQGRPLPTIWGVGTPDQQENPGDQGEAPTDEAGGTPAKATPRRKK